MKKIYLVVSVVISLFYLPDVYAETSELSNYKLPEYYYERVGNDSVKYLQLSNYTFDNNVAYCIEPMISIKTMDYFYTEDLYTPVEYSSETMDKLSLIAYYGYGFEDQYHLDYLAATQKLIWEEVSEYTFNFYTEDNKGGEYIDLSDEINDILNNVNNHLKLSSFANNEYSVLKNESFTLIDDNNVLDFFTTPINNEFSIDGNSIHFNSSQTGEFFYEFDRPTNILKPSLLYHNASTQKMLSRGVVELASFDLRFNVYETSLEIIKKGEVPILNNNGYTYDNVFLEGVEFDVYANEIIYSSKGEILYYKGDFIKRIRTNKNGYAVLENLHFGNYFLIESYTHDEYVRLENPIYFELKKDSDIYSSDIFLEIENEYKKGSLEIFKYDIASGLPIANTFIEVYDMNDNIIYSGYTDEYGMIKLENLYIGNFYIKEVESALGYILDDELVFFEIKDNMEIINVNIPNSKIVEIPDTVLNDIYYNNDVLFLIGGLYANFKIYKRKNN